MLVSRSPWCRRRWPALLLAAASITCGGDDLLLPDEGDPAAVAISSGDGQTGRVGEPLPDSLVLRVTDTRGRPVVDQRVVFEPGPGSAGADLSPDTAITDGDGRAASRWVLGTVAGEQRVTARVLAPGPELE
ncbi:MAG TPA: hypothetical protein VNK43_06375, partial [Gemmatimonadales bacterium]|nr:hypothetical protein [Gemmatimonadales bacterium]